MESNPFDQFDAAAPSYDTQLDPTQEKGYRVWMNKIGHTKAAGYRVNDDFTGEDYDYRGFFAKNGPVSLGQGQHLTDEFKKPAHETFSNESKYAVGENAAKAGSWDGENFKPATGANPFDQFDAQEAPQQPAPSMGQQFKRQLGLAARIPIDMIASLPLAAADAGIAARNLITGSNYDSASKMYDQAMSSVFPKPETGIEKGVNIAGQMIAGSKLPAPQAAQQAPANFSQQTMRQMALQKAAQEGYVVPPSTVNPSTTNKVLESIAGKVATEQDASLRNQTITDALMKRSVGLDDAVQMSEDVLPGIRGEAGKAYQALRSAGSMAADAQYGKALDAITAKYQGAAKAFPELARDDVVTAVESVRKSSFDADSAIDAISILRDKSSTAYAQGNKALGKAYREISGALEGAIERNLASRGGDAAKMLGEFRQARQLIAKTYTAEKALNQSAGSFNASKLATELAKGKPVSGEAKKVAEFAQAFPKAARLVLDSGSVRNTDVILGAGTAALSREPTYLLYPFARQAVRNALLSEPGQRVLTTPGLQPHPSLAMSLLYGIEGTRKNALAE